MESDPQPEHVSPLRVFVSVTKEFFEALDRKIPDKKLPYLPPCIMPSHMLPVNQKFFGPFQEPYPFLTDKPIPEHVKHNPWILYFTE